jgi:hypothetical protein
LTRRYVATLVADRGSALWLHVVQAPLLGLLMLAAFAPGSLQPAVADSGAASGANSPTVLLALVLAATFVGLANSVREIARERSVLRRERWDGLSVGAYVLSKAIVLGVLTVVECAVMTYIALLRQRGLGRGLVLPEERVEHALVVALSGLAGVALGLLVSAMARNADRILMVVPAIVFAQFALSGAVFSLHMTKGVSDVAYVSSARWGYAAAAATANVDRLTGDWCGGVQPAAGWMSNGASKADAASGVGAGAAVNGCDAARAPKTSTWGEDMAVLGGMTVLGVAGARLALGRVGRRRFSARA